MSFQSGTNENHDFALYPDPAPQKWSQDPPEAFLGPKSFLKVSSHTHCTEGYYVDIPELNIPGGIGKFPSNPPLATYRDGEIWLYFSILFRNSVGKSKFCVLLL